MERVNQVHRKTANYCFRHLQMPRRLTAPGWAAVWEFYFYCSSRPFACPPAGRAVLMTAGKWTFLSPPREQWRDLLRKWCVPMRAGCVYFGTLFRSCRKSARMMSPQWEQEGFFPGKSQYKRDARSWWMTIIKERLFFLSLFRNSNISTL